MSAYSNMPWINEVRAIGGKFEPTATVPGTLKIGWQVKASPEPIPWPDNRYRNVHAVEKVMSLEAATALCDRLNKGYNR